MKKGKKNGCLPKPRMLPEMLYSVKISPKICEPKNLDVFSFKNYSNKFN